MTPVRTARLLVVLLLCSCSQASPLDPAMKAVEEIRGREFLHDVKNVTIDRADLARHLRAQMEKSTPYPLDQWGAILRALQLVDVPDRELLPKLLTLYESQVLAFYDPHSHTYYSIRQLPQLPPQAAKIADPKMLEETVMVHELTHALQDQHFKLGPREQSLMRDTDASLAWHAVLEGEAVLVMVAHMLRKSGMDFDEVVRDDAMLGMIGSAAQAEQMMDASTPPYFAEMLKFPYLEGLKFAVEAYRRGGWKELDRVHGDPPRTTRQVLHPAEYFERTFKPQPFDPTRPAGSLAVEHLGEFHWRFLVGPSGSAGWVNDRAVVYPGGRVEVKTTWETENHAQAFASAYEAFLRGRKLEATVKRDGVDVTATYVER